jgi:hypothetical protein
MKTYPIERADGSLHAFQICNAFVSMGVIRRILISVEGVSSLKRLWRSDDRLRFTFSGALWVVHEPFGDNSRYWIGPSEAKDHVLEVGPIHEAFVNYKSPLVRFLRFVAGSVKN